MKRTMLVILAISMLMSGCLYAHVTFPADTDLNRTELGHKEGRASNHSALWLFGWGDAGTAAAARNGGISVLHHMDREMLIVLFGIYARHTTIVYGD